MPTIENIRQTAAQLGREYGVASISLFGSYARGTANENSDVDFLLEKGAIRGLIQLAGFHMALEDSLGIPVDLLTKDCLDEQFLKQIQKEEILLYAAN